MSKLTFAAALLGTAANAFTGDVRFAAKAELALPGSGTVGIFGFNQSFYNDGSIGYIEYAG